MARSIRVRILAAIALPAIAILAASSVTLHLWLRADGLAGLDASLRTRAAAMAALVELEEGEWDVDFDADDVPAAELFGPLAAYELRVVPTGVLLGRRAGNGGAEAFYGDEPPSGPLVTDLGALAALPGDRPLELTGAVATVVRGAQTLRTWTGVYLVRAHGPGPDRGARGSDGIFLDADGAPPVVRIAVAQDLAPLTGDLGRLLGLQVGLGLALSALAVLAGWLLSDRIVAPLDRMARAAEGVRAPSPEPLLRLAGTGDEIDRLADALNRSFGRLHAAYALQARFTSDASHELRTPLSVIRSQAEVALRRPRATVDYEEALAAVVVGATRMQDTLDALLLLARADAEGGGRYADPVSLTGIARGLLVACAPEARGLTLRVEGDDDTCVLGDARQLEVVLRNLLSNAVRHTPPPGEVVVAVRAVAEHVLVEVRDTGEGIAPEALPHVFDRFYRVDAGRGRDRGGSGLGLSIVQVIVQQHGGTVEAASTPGVGSTFRVRLPRGPSGADAIPLARINVS